MTTIYKLCSAALWQEAEAAGVFLGSAVDRRDGFIHFSTIDQVKETAARHFIGEEDLLLISVDTEKLGDALKWEPSRGGALFPHLYGELEISAVINVISLVLEADGNHRFPSFVTFKPSGA